MNFRNKNHHISFKNAIEGIVWAFTNHPNFKIHLPLSILAIILGFILKITRIETTILVLTIVFGLGVEMINTSIEEMTDLITVKWQKQAKIAKDVSAGMMLLAAIGTIFIALLIFGPRIIDIFVNQ